MKGKLSIFGFNEICAPTCLDELNVQLGSIFLTNIFVGQFFEIALPWMKGKTGIWMEQRHLKETGHSELSQVEKESKLYPFITTFDDYNEMAIQFGYITLFAAAFPFASIAALINNIVEIRSDAFKILLEMQRPHPREAANIGSWQHILEGLGYIAVVTNCALLAFTSTKLTDILGISISNKIWAALIIEHIVLLLKFVISQTIPEQPSWVREQHAKKQFWKEYSLGEWHPEEDDDDVVVLPTEKSRLILS